MDYAILTDGPHVTVLIATVHLGTGNSAVTCEIIKHCQSQGMSAVNSDAYLYV